MAFNWKCPFCGNNSTIGEKNYSSSNHSFELNTILGGKLAFRSMVVVCPNDECKEVAINAAFGRAANIGGYIQITEELEFWQLRPSSSLIAFPEYIPAAIRSDYEEACKIRDLSPKASATLSRRCLQGIIRDYWSIVRKRLVDEIEALREKVDADTWEAIDAIRKIGNIGAHMERDIDVIIDVDPQEAQLLIGLIEMLIKDWYIARHKRQEHLRLIVEAAESKK
jgi:Txe/YoeB family toxin of Txe-Axe toxin-antitoxin module